MPYPLHPSFHKKQRTFGGYPPQISRSTPVGGEIWGGPGGAYGPHFICIAKSVNTTFGRPSAYTTSARPP